MVVYSPLSANISPSKSAPDVLELEPFFLLLLRLLWPLLELVELVDACLASVLHIDVPSPRGGALSGLVLGVLM